MFTMQRVLRGVDQAQSHYHISTYNNTCSQVIPRGVTRSAMLQKQGEVQAVQQGTLGTAANIHKGAESAAGAERELQEQ